MARVIRGTARGQVIPGEIIDAQAEAKGLREQAVADADATRQKAQEEAETLRQKARAEGLEDGRAEAAALLLRAGQARHTLLAEAEDSLVELALATARRVVGDALLQQPALVRDRAQLVLAQARRARQLQLRVHPADSPHVADLGALPGVTIEEDSTLSAGDCVVVSELGTLDARIDVRFEALRRALQGQ